MMCRHKAIFLFLIISTLVIFVGCGDRSRDIGSMGTLPPMITAGKATVRGRIVAPEGVTAGRRGRDAAASTSNSGVPGAEVSVNKINKTGSLEPVPGLSDTTDINGDYIIPLVPLGNNYVIVASGTVKVNSITKTLTLEKVFSVDETAVASGELTGVDPDVVSTLTTEAVKDIVVSVNNSGVSENEKITGADIPVETVASLGDAVTSAITAAPAGDLAAAVTGGSSAIDSQLAASTDLKNTKDDAATWGSVRVVVIAQGAGRLEGADVYLALGDISYTYPTDSAGKAFFPGLTPYADVAVTVVKSGYQVKRIHEKVSKKGSVLEIKVTMEPVQANTTPVEPDVAGTVSSDGATVADAAVRIYNSVYSATTVTDANGHYAFYNVPSGTYYVVATKSGFTIESKTVVVP